MSQELAPTNVYEVVESQQQTFLTVASTDKIAWAKESQFAIQALQGNDYLNKIAWSNKDSLKNAIVNVSSIGISLNPAKKHAYLVPRDSRVCLDISYMGLMHLAQETGAILWGQAKLVRANDQYESRGIDQAPTHSYNAFASDKDRGDIIGVYCTVKTSDGSYLTEEMNMDDINKIRGSSKSAKGPWKTWPEEMMRKSVVKRASKYWPKAGDRLETAIDAVNTHEGVDFDQAEDLPKGDPYKRLNAALEKRGAEPEKFMPWLCKQIKRDIAGINELTEQEAEAMATRMENAAQ